MPKVTNSGWGGGWMGDWMGDWMGKQDAAVSVPAATHYRKVTTAFAGRDPSVELSGIGVGVTFKGRKPGVTI